MTLSLPAWAPVLSRVMAALLGGYAFTYAFTAALARLLPLHPVDALLVASLPCFVVYTLAVCWAFAARSALRAWLGLAPALPLAALGFWPRLLEWLA
ncbi:iron transporter [Metapseudomonas otitidis]|uniref:iron transporter n=1 Tax=Metapseudomonas otitidis TaxID=319939 RepID=UPI0040555F5A